MRQHHEQTIPRSHYPFRVHNIGVVLRPPPIHGPHLSAPHVTTPSSPILRPTYANHKRRNPQNILRPSQQKRTKQKPGLGLISGVSSRIPNQRCIKRHTSNLATGPEPPFSVDAAKPIRRSKGMHAICNLYTRDEFSKLTQRRNKRQYPKFKIELHQNKPQFTV